MEAAAKEAWQVAQKKIRERSRLANLEKFQQDPVGFGEQILGEHYTDEVKEMMESVRDNPITIARSANATGKSHGSARVAVWFYRVFPQAKVFLTAAPPLDNLRRVLWGEISMIAQTHPNLFIDDYFRSLRIFRNAESFITGVAIPSSGTPEEREAKFAGKHAPQMLFVVDEGDAVPEEVYRGIESCMSGGMARMLITFNPRATAGPVYQKEFYNQANVVHLSALNHPNVTSGTDIIPGAVDRNITVRRIHEWTRSYGHGENIGLDSFTPPDYLVGYQATSTSGELYPPLSADPRKIIEPAFSYMVLGEYPHQSETQLISSAWIDAAVERWHNYVAQNGEVPPPNIRPKLGIDVAEYGHDANIACLRYGSFVPHVQSWQGMDTDLTADKALELHLRYDVDLTYIDGTGVGSNIAPAMARRGRAMGREVRAVTVKVAAKPSNMIKTDLGEFKALRDQLWWACREWLRTDPNAMLPPDHMLIAELKTPTYRNNPTTGKIEITKKDTLREQLKRSPDRADALCLTFNPVARPTIMRLSDALG